MAAGAGSVWVANRLDGTVSRIDRDEEIVTIDVEGGPTGLAFGAGSLWVADGQGRTVAQLDPDTNKVEDRIEVGNAAHAVAAGFDALWVASAADATVVRIDLEGRGEAADPIAVEARPSALAAGAGRGLGRERGHVARDPARSAFGGPGRHHLGSVTGRAPSPSGPERSGWPAGAPGP